MGGNLQAIWNKVCEINDKLDLLPSLIEISGNQVNVYTLDELGDNLGLIKAGEFRSGNNRIPGDNFSGIRIRYPMMSYPDTSTASSDLYNLAGVDADTMQVGIRASDGVLLAGGGKVELNAKGITLDPSNEVVTFIKWAYDSDDIPGPNGMVAIAYAYMSEGADSTISSDYGATIGLWSGYGTNASTARFELMAQTRDSSTNEGGMMRLQARCSIDTGPAGNYFVFETLDTTEIEAGMVNMLQMDLQRVWFNRGCLNIDFAVGALNHSHMLFVDADRDNVYIGAADSNAAAVGFDTEGIFIKQSTAGTPGDGYGRIFVNTDGELRFIDTAGADYLISMATT